MYEYFLKTDRLILRNLTQDDVNNLVELDSDPEVMRFINGGIVTTQEAIIDEFLPYAMSYYDKSDNLGFWAIVERQSQEFIYLVGKLYLWAHCQKLTLPISVGIILLGTMLIAVFFVSVSGFWLGIPPSVMMLYSSIYSQIDE